MHIDKPILVEYNRKVKLEFSLGLKGMTGGDSKHNYLNPAAAFRPASLKQQQGPIRKVCGLVSVGHSPTRVKERRDRIPRHQSRRLLDGESTVSSSYKPGNKVPESGIYHVNHDRHHIQPHEVTCVEGETFPPCRGCGHGVTFTLVRPATHIRKHSQF